MWKQCVEQVQAIEGRSLTDMGLIIALVAVVCAGILTLFGDNIEASFLTITGRF